MRKFESSRLSILCSDTEVRLPLRTTITASYATDSQVLDPIWSKHRERETPGQTPEEPDSPAD